MDQKISILARACEAKMRPLINSVLSVAQKLSILALSIAVACPAHVGNNPVAAQRPNAGIIRVACKESANGRLRMDHLVLIERPEECLRLVARRQLGSIHWFIVPLLDVLL